ncbi:MAG: superoxide dismutase family protein [Idiomarina sp.]|nr:superoxide dismutase family protein [Idiomarina sp.]
MKRFLSVLIPTLALTACGGQNPTVAESGVELFTSTIVPTEGNSAEGVVTFRRTGDGIAVVAHIEGLEPNTRHGFHIHQYGDCTASDGSSAGGHFNPTGERHGGRHDDERHVGDLGNLESNDSGVASLEYIDDRLSMDGRYTILGRGVIVHAQADDYETQPTGDAGGRIGCGVIGVAERE